MRLRSSLSRRAALLITIVSPALLGFVKCVFVSNPTVATARIERIARIGAETRPARGFEIRRKIDCGIVRP